MTGQERLEGSRTSQAAEYPAQLCQEVARIARLVAKSRIKATGAPRSELNALDNHDVGEVRDHRGAQRFVSHLWATQLADSLPWKVARAYKFRKPNHINILECHVHQTLMQVAPMDCRLVAFQDSMVTLGPTAKGRSSSESLNRVLRGTMSLQLAKNIFPVGIHCPTWSLRADDPSRQKRVRPPRCALPRWFLTEKSN